MDSSVPTAVSATTSTAATTPSSGSQDDTPIDDTLATVATGEHQTGHNHKRNFVVRFVRDTQTCSVNGFLFTFIHQLEGKWSGEVHEMRIPRFSCEGGTSDVIMSEVSVVSTKIAYQPEGHWIYRQTTAKVYT
eukprot:GHVQ01015926.1.p1 GENE.GHVQ01015926.1~~GHVQ01015926.1.p1  ORF type:complete len:133 (+),score=12.90 GHVQ01015926.1:282-680(+)